MRSIKKTMNKGTHPSGDTMHKRAWSKTVSVVCCAALASCLTPACALAKDSNSSDYEKTQVVYIKAGAHGNQRGVYVVNQFEASDDTQVTDAGDYQSVKNITDNQQLDATGSSRFKVKAGDPYIYQGNLDAQTQTPWTISATYKLDGEEIATSELAGASGKLEMGLSIKPNKNLKGNYADNYLLQVSGALDNDQASNVKALDATTAQATGATQLSYMVFPGKSAIYKVTADVKNFEFDGWQIVGVPLAIALDVDDNDLNGATSDLDDLEDAISDLNEGADKIKNSTKDLADGIGQLKDGGQSINEGLEVLSDKGKTLEDAASRLKSGVSSQASQLSEAGKGIDVTSTQSAYAQAAQDYTTAFAGAFSNAFLQAYQEALASGANEKDAQQTARQSAAQSASEATPSQYQTLQGALTDLITAQATKSGYESAAQALDGVSSSCDELSKGISTYVGGVGKLSSATDIWTKGAANTYNGVVKLTDGAKTLADGSSDLASETSGMSRKMIDKVKDELEDYLNPSFTLRDFVNNSTKNVSNVQFVYKTDAIEIPDDDEDDNTSVDNRSIIDKFLELFGM